MTKSAEALRALRVSPQNEAPDSALLRSEEVARRLTQAFAPHQPAQEVTVEDEAAEANPPAASTARAGVGIRSPQPQILGVRDGDFVPRGHVLSKSRSAQDLLKMLDGVDPRGAVQQETVDDVTPGDVEDEDEIWKKFVFEGDSAEISRKAFAQAREQTKQELLQLANPADSDIAEAASSSIPDMRSPMHDNTPSRRLLEDPQGDGTSSCASIAATGPQERPPRPSRR